MDNQQLEDLITAYPHLKQILLSTDTAYWYFSELEKIEEEEQEQIFDTQKKMCWLYEVD